MSKKRFVTVIGLCISLVLIISLAVFASDNAKTKIPKDFFAKFGRIVKYYNDNSDGKVGFKVGSIQVPVSEVEKKKELLEQAGNSNATYDEAVKRIVREKLLLKEANKRGIEITTEQARRRSL